MLSLFAPARANSRSSSTSCSNAAQRPLSSGDELARAFVALGAAGELAEGQAHGRERAHDVVRHAGGEVLELPRALLLVTNEPLTEQVVPSQEVAPEHGHPQGQQRNEPVSSVRQGL